MTPTYDVTSSFVQTIDADRDEAYEVLARLDPMRSLADRLSALGLDDRAIWCESGAARGERELVFSLIWRFDGSGRHARIDWRLRVGQDAAGRSVLAAKLGARGSDAHSRKRVLGSWLLVEELARGHVRRLGRMLEDYAEDDYVAEVPRLRAAG
jgi:hypothetical protein